VNGRINVNGTITAPEAAVVSPLDRGFLFGDGVYETLRTYGGRPFLLHRHLQRLRDSAAALEIEPAAAPVDVEREIARTLQSAALPEAAIRVVLTRGPGPIGYDPAGAGPPTVVVYVRPCPAIPDSWLHEGVDVAITRVRRDPEAPLHPSIKSVNLLHNLLAWNEARRLGTYEPLLLNTRGELAEGGSSNLFLVRQDRLLTPPPEAGLLAGITRSFVIDLARRAGIDVAEEPLLPADLRGAREAFLTSTLKGILPIRRCDGWPIHDGRPGPVTARLLLRFGEAVQAETNAGSEPGSILR
jgi:branched-chain amino acid aminotransferase